jgi:hypothetical protein
LSLLAADSEDFTPAFIRRLVIRLETGSLSSGNAVKRYSRTQIKEIRKLGDKAATMKNEACLISVVVLCSVICCIKYLLEGGRLPLPRIIALAIRNGRWFGLGHQTYQGSYQLGLEGRSDRTLTG